MGDVMFHGDHSPLVSVALAVALRLSLPCHQLRSTANSPVHDALVIQLLALWCACVPLWPAPAPTQADLKSVNHIIFMLQENRAFESFGPHNGTLQARHTLYIFDPEQALRGVLQVLFGRPPRHRQS
jgi:hypothetical protein